MRRVFLLKRTCVYIAFVVFIFVYIVAFYHRQRPSPATITTTTTTFIHKTCADALMHQMLRTIPANENHQSPWSPNPEMVRRLNAIQSTSRHPRLHKQTCVELCQIQLAQSKFGEPRSNESRIDAEDGIQSIPDSCAMHSKGGTAIIIPVEQGTQSVQSLIQTLNELLRVQKLCYRIFLVEHTLGKDEQYKNPGILMNVGFIEAAMRFETACIVFHDPGLIVNRENPGYRLIQHQCNAQTIGGPIHMSVVVNNQLAPSRSLAGVLRIRPKHFIDINGFSNWYWNMSGVYEDFERRIRATGLEYDHEDLHNAQYETVNLSANYFQDQSSQLNQTTWFLIDHASQRMGGDGLRQLYYRVVSITEGKHFTHLKVELNKELLCPLDVR